MKLQISLEYKWCIALPSCVGLIKYIYILPRTCVFLNRCAVLTTTY